nr:hypothetical protein [Thiocapsa sp. KS1]
MLDHMLDHGGGIATGFGRKLPMQGEAEPIGGRSLLLPPGGHSWPEGAEAEQAVNTLRIEIATLTERTTHVEALRTLIRIRDRYRRAEGEGVP